MNLDYLKKYEKIMIVGHNNPDADSILSSVVLAAIFKYHNINADYAILEANWPVNLDNKVVDDCLNYQPIIIKNDEIPLYKYFLVDHNDPIQSIMDSNLVVGGIDHHPDSNKCQNILFFTTCSTTLAIYELFKDSYEFNENEKKQIFHALLDDSSFGKNARYKESDKEIVKVLGYNPDLEEYFLKYFVPTNLENLNYAFSRNNYKAFTFNDIDFESSYIETMDTNYLNEFIGFVKTKDKYLGMWMDYKTNKTYTYFIYDDLYHEKEYNILAPRSTIVLNDTIDFLRKSGKNV